MTEYLPAIIAIFGAGASWYCYQWGHADGYAEGNADGAFGTNQRKLPQPSAGGGPGVPE